MLKVFLDRKGPIDFLEKCATVNSSYYCQILWQNSPYLLNDSHSSFQKLNVTQFLISETVNILT